MFNLDSKKVIYTARRLANANLEVTTRITTDSVASASSLGASLKASASSFGASVLTDLKTKDAATFQSATISVSADSIAVPADKPADSSSGLSMGAIIGIAVGAGLVVIGIISGVAYLIYAKFGAPAVQEETASFEFQSPMLKSQTGGQIVVKRPDGPHRVIGRASRNGTSHSDLFRNLPSDKDGSSHKRNEFEPSSMSSV